MSNDFFGFSDLDVSDEQLEQDTRDSNSKYSKTEKFPCQKCGGTGFYSGVRVHQEKQHCFACKGKGYFLTSADERAKAKAKRDQKKVEKRAEKRKEIEVYVEQNRELFDFMMENSNWNDFFGNLLEAIAKYGKLTEGQEKAAYRSMEKIKAKQAEKAQKRDDNATDVDLTVIHNLFNTAVNNGLKRPKLRMDGLLISLAPNTGRNAGSLYVKSDGEYQGKLTPEGKFFKVRGANEGIDQVIIDFCKNPLESAKLYGQQTGTCACCGRELTDPSSIEAGIGPICEGNWF